MAIYLGIFPRVLLLSRTRIISYRLGLGREGDSAERLDQWSLSHWYRLMKFPPFIGASLVHGVTWSRNVTWPPREDFNPAIKWDQLNSRKTPHLSIFAHEMYIYIEQVIFVQYADKILEWINITFKALQEKLQGSRESLVWRLERCFFTTMNRVVNKVCYVATWIRCIHYTL
jgi:hypothetical protein